MLICVLHSMRTLDPRAHIKVSPSGLDLIEKVEIKGHLGFAGQPVR